MRPVHRLLLAMLWWVAPAPAQPTPSAAPASVEARQIQLAPGLQLDVWAAEPQLYNPVAFSLAAIPSPIGKPGIAAYIAETHRYGISVLDITQNTPWLLNDLSFRTVEQRGEFLKSRFATNAAILTSTSEIVRAVSDTDGDHRADDSAVFADQFQSVLDGTAAGVLARGRDVWFANIPALYRLRVPGPEPKTPPPPSRHTLAYGFGVHIGVTGHDLHGLVFGPDGRLYMSFGDRGLSITHPDGRRIDLPDTGGVLRCEPSGRDLEVYCIGLRNPQELAFDDFGNLFTVDNDTAGADECRVLHLVPGADYGWRASYQHMKGFGPWVQEELWRGGLDGILPPVGTVSQGPAGLTYYPGTGFGSRFKSQFLHCDFPGGVWAFDVRPEGASFRLGKKEKIAWNCWPTDVEFGPDGALYVLDWVAGWNMPRKGRIYRITDRAPSETETAIVPEVHAFLGRDLASESESALLKTLAHADRRVRMAAQTELARRGEKSFAGLRSFAFENSATIPRLHALWAIGHIVRGVDAGRAGDDLSDALASMIRLLDDRDEHVRSQAALLLGEAGLLNSDQAIAELTRDSATLPRLRAAQAMTRLFDGGRAALTVDQKLGRWLEEKLPAVGRVVSRHFQVGVSFHPNGPVILEMVRSNRTADPVLRHAAAQHWVRLERAEATWASYRGLTPFLTNCIVDPSIEVRHTALLALRELKAPEMSRLLTDAEPTLVLQAARAINDVPIPDAYPDLAAMLEVLDRPGTQPSTKAPQPARSLHEQIGRRALNAHYRLGAATDAGALTSFASDKAPKPGLDPDLHVRLRAEALFLLGAWEVLPASPGQVPVFPKADPNHGAVPSVNPENWPGWFDRVVGLWNPLHPRPATVARDALAPKLDVLLRDSIPQVAEAALDAAIRLNLSSAAPTLLALSDPATPAVLRRRIPAALASWNAPELAEALRRALADPDPATRAASVPYLDRLGTGDALPILTNLVQLASLHTNSEPLRLGQAAWSALGKIQTSPSVQALFIRSLNEASAGRFRPELELDLLEAARSQNHAALDTALRQRQASLDPKDPLATWREVLTGGDAVRGRAIFFESPETQCSRCHKVGNEGGIVGPALDGIGNRLDRRQLLDAILHPNAQISPGFENVLITLRDGREISGILRSESPAELKVVSVDAGESVVPTGQILERRRTLSAMPEGLADLLQRRQLRDLLEYLSSLR